MKPPYDAPYWDGLTDRQKLNDLVHKIAQLGQISYAKAYMTASNIIDAKSDTDETYPIRLAHAGLLPKAIQLLIAYHVFCMEG